MSKGTNIGSAAFPFAEILQHYGQTGKTGQFAIKHNNDEAFVFMMSGIIAHAETSQYSGESAMWIILSWGNPQYQWHESIVPSRMTMSGVVEDILVKSIEMIDSGELELLEQNISPESVKTRNITDNDQTYLILFKISSVELPPFDFQLTSKQLRIGRHPDNDLVLPDTSISRKHALCICNQGAILVKDLGSMNGIKIDGESMTQGLARDGQILTIGEVNCEVHVSSVGDASITQKTLTPKVLSINA